MNAASNVLGLAFRDVWKQMWTMLVVHLLFLFGNLLIIPGPPATVALFFLCNRIAHDEMADERDFLRAIRTYWTPAWHWGFLNLTITGLLAGDYLLTGLLVQDSDAVYWLQGFYITLLVGWLMIQMFALPFLFEQEQPLVSQALRNSVVFIRRNLILVLLLTLMLVVSLAAGVLMFMLTFVFGGALVSLAGNHAILNHLADE